MATTKKVVKKTTAKKSATKPTAKKVVAKKPVSKKVMAKKTAPKKTVTKKAIAKKPAPKKVVAKKPAPKKVVVKKPAPKKVVAKKTPAKKVITKTTPPKKVPVKSIQPSFSLVASIPTKTKKTPAPVQHTTLKTNLFELMPEYEAPEEEVNLDYMNEKQKDHFHNLLNTWKQQLMTEVDRTVEHMKDETGNFADPADRATQEEGFSLELRARDRERNLIKKIEEAIRRLEEGEYGYCEACGVEIGYKRLEARPTATLCIDCKTVDEIRERQLAS